MKRLLLWLALGFVVLAGASLVWPVNSTLLSGDCIGGKLDDGSCPTRWDQVDTDQVPGAVGWSVVLTRAARWATLVKTPLTNIP